MFHIDAGTVVIWFCATVVAWLSIELLCAVVVAAATSKWSWRHSIFGSAMIALGFDRLPKVEAQTSAKKTEAADTHNPIE